MRLVARPEFQAADELEPEEVERLVRTVRARILRRLRRRGLLPAAVEKHDSVEPESPSLRPSSPPSGGAGPAVRSP